ncbi:histidine kinase [Marispirochaeta aestuarii]|uniref:histidine kinase n=1 Tax=Marispirochaeta aestuarii TaxID=1963862 RepID=UPI002ABDC40F|nr:histidine kinase [Marispirochaeta aestuarii]
MSLRKRIFRTYLILIILVLVYLLLSLFLSSFRLRMERDKNDILEVKTIWGEMLVFMNETVYNWNDGKTFDSFIEDSRLFEEKLEQLTGPRTAGWWYEAEIRRYLDNLYAVWKMAKLNIHRIVETRSSPEFLAVESLLIQEPGLQRLYHIYIRFIEDGRGRDEIYAYALKEYIDGVEFFPVYSSTVNYVFIVILDKVESLYGRISIIQNSLSIVFFGLFLFSFVLISSHFTDSISRPITQLNIKLNEFIGRTVERERLYHNDEVAMLEASADDLIEHYTHLARLAGRLSRGHIETSLLSLPRQGVVGKALKEVASYLKGLAKTADWIRDGKYGAQVKEKSEQDVLARSFNIMSGEIAEKISTLRSMFEAIDEGIILADCEGRILEANQKFLSLMEVGDPGELDFIDIFNLIIPEEEIQGQIRKGLPVYDLYCTIFNRKNERIPVKVNVRPLNTASDGGNSVMMLISNESLRVRMKREQETLAAQALEAELRALRAQINPHFFFNTLNTIAHLIETDSTTAVGVVEKLAGMFRYTLLSTKHKTVRLHEELLHVREFLAIEKIRHGSRLEADFIIEQAVEESGIPPMLLQPIVENSIKHGADKNGIIRIMLKACREQDDLCIDISDAGDSEVDIAGLLDNSRTGLQNVNQRLMTLYRKHLEFIRRNTGGLMVRIRVPLDGEGTG